MAEPYIKSDGTLIIPFDAEPRFHHWKGGQSVLTTLAELSAPLAVWRNYAEEDRGLIAKSALEETAVRCERRCSRCGRPLAEANDGGIVYCASCVCYFAPAESREEKLMNIVPANPSIKPTAEIVIATGNVSALIVRPAPLNARDQIISWARAVRAAALVLDTETTGLSANDEVIEIAVVSARDGKVLFDERVRPTAPITAQAFRVHGISLDDLNDAPALGEVWPRLLRILQQQTVIAYGASFDRRMLKQSAQRYGLEVVSTQWECLMARFSDFANADSSVSLVDACASFGFRFNSHRARADAMAAAELLSWLADGATRQASARVTKETDEREHCSAAQTPGEYLGQFGWHELKGAWIDPLTGEALGLGRAMDLQRSRQMEEPRHGKR